MILQRILLPGFHDPTVIYQVETNGQELITKPILKEKGLTIIEIGNYILDLDYWDKPVFIEPGFHLIKDELKKMGVRVVE